jgi:UDP:flavonoid glycosyltransferase YjiC (YdhE family)
VDEDEFDFPALGNQDLDAVYESMESSKLKLKENQNLRENRRIRNSASFRIGVVITTSIRRPWRLLILPFSLMILGWNIIQERLGNKSRPYPLTETFESINQIKRNDCVVLFPTNGVGFGHFTRMYGLAKRIRAKSPSTEIVFFTTMPALQILYNEGFPSYHLAGRKKHKNMTAIEWNALVEESLSLVFNQHKPKAFVFDGAFPYRGMLNAIRGQSRMDKIWVRRGMFKKGSNIPIDSIEHFSLIVRPGDSVDIQDHVGMDIDVESKTVEPMLLLDQEELLSEKEAKGRLRLPNDARVVYVQLGAGRINDIDSEIRLTVDALLSNVDIHVVVGESMLGERIMFNHPRVTLLRDYPNSIYFNAFSASVQAGGYNSFHEMRTFGLPTLFYPNMNTGMDDQLARCNIAQSEGWGLVLKERTEASIASSIEALLDLEVLHQRPLLTNGADELATLLLTKMR